MYSFPPFFEIPRTVVGPTRYRRVGVDVNPPSPHIDQRNPLQKRRPPGPEGAGGPILPDGRVLDGVADRAQDLADLAAQEDEGDDRDDRDEGEDQGVLGESLAFLVPIK